MVIKRTGLWKVFQKIKRHKKTSLYILLTDILFFFIIYLLNHASKGMQQAYQLYGSIQLLLIFSMAHLAFILFFYSIMKFLVLLMVKSIYERAEFSMQGYLKFVLLNIILGALIAAVFALSVLVIGYSVKEENIQAAITAITGILGVFFFLYINMTHISFVLYNKISKSVGEGSDVVFRRFKTYAPLLLNVLLISVLYVVSIGILMLVFGDVSESALRYNLYTIISSSVTSVLLYVLVFINRMHLFDNIYKLVK